MEENMTLVQFLVLLTIILAVGFGVFYYWDDLSIVTAAGILIGSVAGALLLDVILPRRKK